VDHAVEWRARPAGAGWRLLDDKSPLQWSAPFPLSVVTERLWNWNPGGKNVLLTNHDCPVPWSLRVCQ
jgi:hypothetical protein